MYDIIGGGLKDSAFGIPEGGAVLSRAARARLLILPWPLSHCGMRDGPGMFNCW